MIYLLLGYTKVQFRMHCPESSIYTNEEVETIRNVLKTVTNAKDKDIILSGVKKGSIIAIFMIRSDFIPKLRQLFMSECHKMLQPLKHKILEVLIEDEVIYSSGK